MADKENPQFKIGLAPRWVQSTPTVHMLGVLSAAMEAEDGMCVDVDHQKLLRSETFYTGMGLK
jgi:hypothetical protein